MSEEKGYRLKADGRWISCMRITGQIIFYYDDNLDTYKMSIRTANRLLSEFKKQNQDKNIELIECDYLTEDELKYNKNVMTYFKANHEKNNK